MPPSCPPLAFDLVRSSSCSFVRVGLGEAASQEQENHAWLVTMVIDNHIAAAEEGHIPVQTTVKTRRWLAVGRFASPYWFLPKFGTNLANVPFETHMLLLELVDNTYACILATVDVASGVRATLSNAGKPKRTYDWLRSTCGGDTPLHILWYAGKTGIAANTSVTLAAVAVGRDAMKLPALAARAAGLPEPLSKDNLPPFCSSLMWCTWDSFYHKVSAKDVRAALSHMHRGGLVPGAVLIDDGWQDTGGHYGEPWLEEHGNDHTLRALKATADKFPAGLRSLVDDLKKGFGVQHVGVWHTAIGYWGGVHATLARELGCELTSAAVRIAQWRKGSPHASVTLPAGKNALKFFRQYHSAIAAEGITFVKVDSQNVMEMASMELNWGRYELVRSVQEALNESARQLDRSVTDSTTPPPILHCMAMSNNTMFALSKFGGGVLRNSDDYYPGLPAQAQTNHVFVNAMNAMFTSTCMLPDWDMFQTHPYEDEQGNVDPLAHRACRTHATARAVSGGPVYVSDKSGKSNFALLRSLAVSPTRVLQPDRPALPTRECLFHDMSGGAYDTPKHSRHSSGSLVMRSLGKLVQRLHACRRRLWPKPPAEEVALCLKVSNLCAAGRIGIIGAFHTHRWLHGDVACDCNPEDVHDLTLEDRVVVYAREADSLWVSSRRSNRFFNVRTLHLPVCGCEVITYVPLRASEVVAPLGLLDKLVGAAAVLSWDCSSDGLSARCKLLRDTLNDGASKFGFYCSRPPTSVAVVENLLKTTYGCSWEHEYRDADGFLVVNVQCELARWKGIESHTVELKFV